MNSNINEMARPPSGGRKPLSSEGPCTRDGYTIPKSMLREFRLRCQELGFNRSELIRGWIVWFLAETKDEGESTKHGGAKSS